MQNTTTHPTNSSTNSTGRFVVAALSLAAMLACGGASAQTTATTEPSAAGRILLMPRAGLPDMALDRLLKERGGGKARRIGRSELRNVELRPGMEKRMVERLKRQAPTASILNPAGAAPSAAW